MKRILSISTKIFGKQNMTVTLVKDVSRRKDAYLKVTKLNTLISQ